MREYIRYPQVNEPPRLKKLRNYRVRQEPPPQAIDSQAPRVLYAFLEGHRRDRP